jgi:hypothetical protein
MTHYAPPIMKPDMAGLLIALALLALALLIEDDK